MNASCEVGGDSVGNENPNCSAIIVKSERKKPLICLTLQIQGILNGFCTDVRVNSLLK